MPVAWAKGAKQQPLRAAGLGPPGLAAPRVKAPPRPLGAVARTPWGTAAALPAGDAPLTPPPKAQQAKASVAWAKAATPQPLLAPSSKAAFAAPRTGISAVEALLKFDAGIAEEEEQSEFVDGTAEAHLVDGAADAHFLGDAAGAQYVDGAYQAQFDVAQAQAHFNGCAAEAQFDVGQAQAHFNGCAAEADFGGAAQTHFGGGAAEAHFSGAAGAHFRDEAAEAAHFSGAAGAHFGNGAVEAPYQMSTAEAALAGKRQAAVAAVPAQPVKRMRSRRTSGKNGHLPIRQVEDEVVSVLCGIAPVCCVAGETGSGKSTQVPQMILEEARNQGRDVRIAVTQPRRVAALNLARRVAQELGAPDLGGLVGYRIGGETKPGQCIDFCTTGYLLQLLVNAPKEMERYTHIVLDEVHERSAEGDMLCLVVRLLASGERRGVRIVVMSATLQADLFADYFAPLVGSRARPATISVSTRLFPVQVHFLEELAEVFGGRRASEEVDRRVREMFPDQPKAKQGSIDPKHVEKLHTVICDVIQQVAQPGCMVLIFLPGVAEISALWQELKWLEDGGEFQVLPLHSMVPREEQELVLQDVAPEIRRVVLATDIAESSLTLPNVVAVIDLGLHRRLDHTDRRAISCLSTKFISRAAATQRAGRAGRTRPGVCIRLYTKRFFEQQMAEHATAEALSMPLERLYLQSKQFAQKLMNHEGSPKTAGEVLAQMVQPPSVLGVAAARQELADLGALDRPDEHASITPLGHLCIQLPLEPRVARVVWLSSLWGCVADGVVLAAALSSLEPFLAPSPHFVREEKDYFRLLREATCSRLLFDGGMQSEPLMIRQVFMEWLVELHAQGQWSNVQRKTRWGPRDAFLGARRSHTDVFAKRFVLARGRMEHFLAQVLDISLRSYRASKADSHVAEQLKALIKGLGYAVSAWGELGPVPPNEKPITDVRTLFEENVSLLKGLLAAAFSDTLLVGSYWGAYSNKAGQIKLLLQKLCEKGVSLHRSALFATEKDQPLSGIESYVDDVCGRRVARSQEVLEGLGFVLVKLDTSGELPVAPLSSRVMPSSFTRSGDSERKEIPQQPWEFNLLHHFSLAMREMQRSNRDGKWGRTGHAPQHPCEIKWELMQPEAPNPKGKGKGKRRPARCAAFLDRKNAVGFVLGLPHEGEELPKQSVATFGVASTVQGSEAPNRAYPSGVTVLQTIHIGFVLVTAKVDAIPSGLRRFGLAQGSCLSILDRSIALPCFGEAWWEQVRQLRAAIRRELTRDVAPPAAGLSPTILTDAGEVQDGVWGLLTAGLDFDEQEATASPVPPMVTVDLLAGALQGATALQPYATWEVLRARQAQLWPEGPPQGSWEGEGAEGEEELDFEELRGLGNEEV